MRLTKQFFNFYINSSIHVALSVLSLTWITLIECGINNNKNLLLFVFFASITGYNFVKYFGVAKFHHRSLTNTLKLIQFFSFLSFILMGAFALKLERETIIFIIFLGLITFLYAIPFLPKHLFLDKQQNLRSIGGLKIYLIALTWSGTTVFIPIINTHYSINIDIILIGIQRFIFTIALMLPFEIRDLQYDSLKLSTIPQKIGIKATKTIGFLILILFFFMEFLKNNTSIKNLIIVFIITVITGLFLKFSKTNQHNYYSAFWVESIPVLWVLLMLFKRLI